MRILLAVLAALALGGLLAPAAHGAPGLEIALQDDAQLLSEDPGRRAAAFAHARALRVASVRANVPWASVVSDPTAAVAPAAVSYDFSRFDRLADEAAANGMRVQLTLTGPAPAWATGNGEVGANRPSPARFAEFAAAAAGRLSGRVRALSIWNEPNWHGLLTPERVCGEVTRVKRVKGKGARRRVRQRVCVKTSARIYRELYRAGHAAIKRAAPAMPVWIGETNPYVNRRGQSTAPLAWIRQLACADGIVKRCRGAALRADGYAHHPYAFDRAPGKRRSGAGTVTMADLGKLRKELTRLRTRLRVAGGAIYLTEFAYYTSGPNAKPQKTRAKWTRQAFEMALKAPKVRQLLYYQLVDPAASLSWRTGLISSGGSAHAAYSALRTFASARRSRLTLPSAPFALPPAR